MKLYDNFEKKKVRIFIKKGQYFQLSTKEQIEKISIPIYEGFFIDSPADEYFYVIEWPYWRYKRPLYAVRKDVFNIIFEQLEVK